MTSIAVRRCYIVVYCLCLIVSFPQSHGFTPQSPPPRTLNNNAFTASIQSFKTRIAVLTDNTQIQKEQKQVQANVVRNINTKDEFQSFLNDNENNKPRVVLYHAKWCKRCQQLKIQFHHVAKEFKGNFRFVAMECTSDTREFLSQEMDVSLVPNIRIYNHQGTSDSSEQEVINVGASARELVQQLTEMNLNTSPDTDAVTTANQTFQQHEQLQLSLGVANL